MRRGQRKTEVTLIKKADFINALVQHCGCVSRAAAAIQTSRASIYRWQKEDADFRAACEDAQEEVTEAAERELYRRGVEGVEKPVYQGKELVGHIREYSDACLIFWLKARRPEIYRERQQVEHVGEGFTLQVNIEK